jgi:hypothetical protein
MTSEVVEIAGGCTYVQGEIEMSRGEEWSSKGTDRCPLTIDLYSRQDTLPLFTLFCCNLL